MRVLLAVSLGVLTSLALATGVASAAPGQSSWDDGTAVLFDQCTGESVANTFKTHLVETDGHFHFNTHIEGIGETTGLSYVGNNVDNEVFHARPDGNFMVDQVLTVRLVSQGNLPNSWLKLRMHLVVDSDDNVISGTSNFSFGCTGD
jgi:hypothetical protein